MIMDDVEITGPFHQVTDMQAFHYLGIEGTVFFVPGSTNGFELAGSAGIGGGEQCYVQSVLNEPLRYISGDLFPGAIMQWRGSPGYRGQYRDLHVSN